MKKMMIMMVLLGSAVAAQAVTLKWGANTPTSAFLNLTGGAMTAGVTSETSSMVVLYILASNYATFNSSTTKATALSNAGETALGSTSLVGRFGANILPNITGSSAGISYVARVYATFGGTEYYLDNTVGWTTTAGGNDTITETKTWTAGTWGGATGSFGTHNAWVAVPEPTSMALLALGIAAIGLRRKNRK